MTAERTRRHSLPGTQHFINPKQIPAERDFVALSTFGATARWLVVVGAVLLMISSIYLILDGAFGLGSSRVESLFSLATNPFIGLLIGVVATASIQSSTTITALTVTAVGTGGITVPVAVPIILGANLGTTITPGIVSFSYVGDRDRFRRAFTSASLHTWFNLTFVAVVFLLELLFRPLQHLTDLITGVIDTDGSDTSRGLAAFFEPVIRLIGTDGLIGALLPAHVAAVTCIIVGMLGVLGAVRILNSQLSVLTAPTTRTLLERSSGASDALGFSSGLFMTAIVQASSVTVSSLLPFAASKSLKLREILSITLGANVGTTIMALLTAFAVPGSMGTFALQAALVHITYNLVSALVVLFVRPVREWLIRCAQASGRLAARGYSVSAIALAVGYFVLPALVILAYSVLT